MTVVFLIGGTAVSPWSRPADWQDAGHQVELVGCGGDGGAGVKGANAGNVNGGGAGAYTSLTAPSGSLGATTPFAVSTHNTSTSDHDTSGTFWEGTTTTNTYEAQCGIAGSQTIQGTGGVGATNGTPSPVAYTRTSNSGGSAGIPTGGSFFAGPGGGGAGGPSGAGKNSGTTTTQAQGAGGSGGGGANGGTAGVQQTGGNSGTNGGDGIGGTGHGTGSTSPTTPNGSAGTVGGGGGGGCGNTAGTTTGMVGSGLAGGTLGNVSNWTQTSDSSTAGAGGGGGGGGAFSGNVTVTSNGGNGADYGGGGGAAGACRGTSSTNTGGTGGKGIIVVTYTGAAPKPIWGWDQQEGERFYPRQFSHMRRAGAIMRGQDDPSAWPQFEPWINLGYEQTVSQDRAWPETKRRAAATMRGDEGNQAPFVRFLGSFETQDSQDNVLGKWFRRSQANGAIARGDDGTQAIKPFWQPDGFEQVSAQEPPFPPRKRIAAFTEDRDDGDYVPTVPPLFAWGYDVQQQPTRESPWRNRIAAMLRGDEGIAVPTPIYEPLGFEEVFATDVKALRDRRVAALFRGDDGTQSPFAPFFPDGWTPVFVQPPHPRPERSGALARWLEGIDAPLARAVVPWFEVTASQDRYSRTRTYGALMPKADGIEAPFVNWIELGFEAVASQDQAWPLSRLRAAGFLRGDDGIASPFVNWANVAYEVVSQEPHLRRERSGAIARGLEGIDAPLPPPSIPWFETTPATTFHRLFRTPEFGDSGVAAPFVNWANVAYQVVSQEPHPRRERSGALARGLDGTDASLPPPPVPWFEFNQPTTLHRLFKSPEFGDAGIAAPLVPFTPLDWPWLAMHRHPRPELSGALARGADGIEFPLPRPLVPWFETTPPFFRHPVYRAPEFGDLGIAAPFVNWANVAYQVVSQEPHPRRERAAVLMRGDDGIAFPIVVPLPIWFETTPALVRYRGYRAPEFGDSGIAAPFAPFFPGGWSPTFSQDRFARVRLGGALLRGDDGTQAVTPVYEPLGFEETFATDLHVRRERAGAVLRGDDGIAFPLPRALVPWWETPVPFTYHRSYRSPETGETGIASPFVSFTALEWPPPPMHRNPTRRLAGGVFRGDDGNYVQTQVVLPFVAWPEPPMHRNPTPRRTGAILRGDEGIENVLPPFVLVPFGWWDDRLDTYRKPPSASARAAATKHRMTFPVFPKFRDYGFAVQPPQPPHPKPERSGAIQVGEPGVEAPAIRFRPYGWEVQPPQPPHPAREKRGAILKGDEGTELFFILNIILPNVGWPEPPMHKRPERWRGGALMRGPDGTDAPQILFRPYGWEIQPPQPPHPMPERRAAAVFKGDEGIERFFIPPLLSIGYFVQSPQPPHRGVERAGAILRGDEGIVRPFVRFLPYGWEVQPVQPPKWPRTFREGAVALGDPGTQAPFRRFFPLGFEPTPPLFFRRPKPHVPVFLLQSVESYATFVAPHPAASAHTEITAFSAATTIGRMEIELIIEAFKAATVITRKDT